MHKLAHIHVDQKFTNDTVRYIDERLINEILFIGDFSKELESKLGKLNLKYSIIPKTEESIPKIIAFLSEYDIIVINKLCNFNTKLLKAFPNHYKVFFRLFGYELYGKQAGRFISKRTKLAIYPIDINTRFFSILKNFLKRYNFTEYFGKNGHKRLYEKIDRILLVNRYEYQQLSKYFYLPEMLQLPLINTGDNVNINTKKANKIIIGNSKHFWNNHLDVLLQLKDVRNIDNYHLFLFFSYGSDNNYTAEVRKLSRTFKKITLQEDFLDLTTFETIFFDASAIVINSYRQHALGNIITAMFSGCKIYLNEKSSTYIWLKENHFIVSKISSLADDISNNKAKLSQNDMEHNIAAYFELQGRYTKADFINNIIKFIEE